MPSPTQRFHSGIAFVAASDRARVGRLTTLDACPRIRFRHFLFRLRNQRFPLCSRFALGGLLVEWLGMQTRLTPWANRCCLVLGGVECGILLPPCAGRTPPALLDCISDGRLSSRSESLGRRIIDPRSRSRSGPPASCNFTILPNSFGLPALPLRMISVDGSNRLSILPSACVSPRKIRASRLLHHLLDQRHHRVELFGAGLRAPTAAGRSLRASFLLATFFGETASPVPPLRLVALSSLP